MNKRGDILFIGLNDLREDFIKEAHIAVGGQNKKMSIRNKWIAVGMILLILLLPNASPVFAKALIDIPIVGQFFEVITFNKIDERNGNSEIKIEAPEILSPNNLASVEQVNDEISTYIETSLMIFKAEHGEERSGLHIDYKIVTDNNRWFSLLVYSTEIGASAYESNKYYNIDKISGKTVAFKDLFKDFELVKGNINHYLIEEMKRQMTADDSIVYFIQDLDDTGFQTVSEDQSYFMNEEGQLVVSFNEYEVAPGFMGTVQFIIPEHIYRN
jgi:hypothetical protein